MYEYNNMNCFHFGHLERIYHVGYVSFSFQYRDHISDRHGVAPANDTWIYSNRSDARMPFLHKYRLILPEPAYSRRRQSKFPDPTFVRDRPSGGDRDRRIGIWRTGSSPQTGPALRRMRADRRCERHTLGGLVTNADFDGPAGLVNRNAGRVAGGPTSTISGAADAWENKADEHKRPVS